MSNPYESAYFLILGQITLILSAILFAVPVAIIQTDGPLQLDFYSVFFCVFVTVACFISAFSILIGWVSIKTAIKTVTYYNNKLFMINILGIVCLFMINNTVMFSLSAAYSMTSFTSFVLPEGLSASPALVGIASGTVYSLNALYLFLCKAWNEEFRIASSSPQDRPYELLLSFTIGIQVVCGFSAFFFRIESVMIVAFAVWVLSWLVINYRWIVTHLLGSTPPAVGT